MSNFYMVCVWDQYYPSGGISNIKGVFRTPEEAEKYILQLTDVALEDKWKLRDHYEIFTSEELPWMTLE